MRRLDRVTYEAGLLVVAAALTFAFALAVQGRWGLTLLFVALALVAGLGVWHVCREAEDVDDEPTGDDDGDGRDQR